MYFKREGAISTLSGKPKKLVDQFTYPNSNISSSEDVNAHLAETRNAMDRISIYPTE